MILQGHSGCKLSITSEGNVRKLSPSVEYNHRLINQATKQDQFENSKGFMTPKILSISTEQELYYFEMEYINAPTFANFIIHEDFEEVKLIFSRLVNFVTESINSVESFDVTAKVYDKTRNISLDEDSSIRYFLGKVENEELRAPTGKCHGDLTFENILVDKEVFLIDFLDSFLDTPLIDLAKISQEFNVYWSFRNYHKLDGILVSKMKVLSDIFSNSIYKLNPDYKKAFRYLEVLNLIRILPYTKDIKTYMLLKKAINRLNQFL